MMINESGRSTFDIIKQFWAVADHKVLVVHVQPRN